METIKKKLTENINILIILVGVLLVISIVQAIFLIRFHKLVDQEPSPVTLKKNYTQNQDDYDDLLKRFDANSWNPFEEFQSLRQQMDRMFDDSKNRFKLSPFFDDTLMGKNVSPQTDLEVKDGSYIVTMNIPGSNRAEIQVDLDGDLLVVSAQTKSELSKKSEKNYLKMERIAGNFQRSLRLPGPVDANAMKTEYEDGVLTIILPKQK